MRKGREFATEFMDSSCQIVAVTEESAADLQTTGFQAFLKFVEPFRGISGTLYVMVGLDLTVYPADAAYVQSCFAVLSQVVSMSPAYAGWILLPVHQSQTTQSALVKHRRAVEDALVKLNLSLRHEVAVLYQKPEGSRDGRGLAQQARFVLHSQHANASNPWNESPAVSDLRVGPCPLAKITEFIGYDPDARPGAAARVEQKLDFGL